MFGSSCSVLHQEGSQDGGLTLIVITFLSKFTDFQTDTLNSLSLP